MTAYADTSFLVSLYTLDANSVQAAKVMDQTQAEFFLTSFGELELLNAIQLRRFRKEMNDQEVKAALAIFRQDIRNGIFLGKPMKVSIYNLAKRISRERTPEIGSRTLDILHVASALILKADGFFTFDRNQKNVAIAEGLRVF